MTIDADVLARESVRLYEAMLRREPVSPSRERLVGLTVPEAYEIQRGTIELRERAGARRVGRKVGLTSAAMQEFLGVREPDYGVLLDDMIVPAEEGVDADRLIAPRAEPEIAFILGSPLTGDAEVEDVLAAAESVCAAVEIIDSRIADWRIAIEDTVADNASSALVVLGAPHPPEGLDLEAEGVRFRVGDQVETGRGEAVLGHPAQAVAWLAQALAAYGEGLEAGDIVLPGAMTKALAIAAGDAIRVSFETLGELKIGVR